MDSLSTYDPQHCRIHPERPAAGKCAGCVESFCKECLGPNGNCPACNSTAERFLEGFSSALARWEASLRNPQAEVCPAPPRRSKKSLLIRLLAAAFLLGLGWYLVPIIKNYDLFLGQMFIEQGNPAKARFHLEKAAGRDPQNADLRLILGNLYYEQGELDEAMASFKLCIELDSLQAGAMNNLAWIYSQVNIKTDEALQLSKRSLELEPNNPAYLDTLAEIYFLKKDYYRALTYIRKAVDQKPPNLEYYKQRLEKIKRLAYSQKKIQEV